MNVTISIRQLFGILAINSFIIEKKLEFIGTLRILEFRPRAVL